MDIALYVMKIVDSFISVSTGYGVGAECSLRICSLGLL
jgi:hypothetical protein